MNQPLVMPVLAYTQSMPTVPGHYWVQSEYADEPTLELLDITSDGQVYYLDHDYDRTDYTLDDGNWYCGPVLPPALPEGFVSKVIRV